MTCAQWPEGTPTFGFRARGGKLTRINFTKQDASFLLCGSTRCQQRQGYTHPPGGPSPSFSTSVQLPTVAHLSAPRGPPTHLRSLRFAVMHKIYNRPPVLPPCIA
eukprot:6005013-Pyramimonas_sp.AAC.1